MPATDAKRRNQRLRGIRRRNSQHSQYHAASRNNSVPRPTMMSQERCTVLICEIVGRSSGGTSVSCDPCGMSSPWTTVAVPSVGSDSHEARPGIADPSRDGPVAVEVAEQGLGHVARRLRHELDGGELDRLVVVDPAGERVADRHLERNRDGGHAERDQEADPVVAVLTPPQHGERVDRRHEEPTDDVGREHHVGGHQRHRVVEDHAHRIDVDDLAAESSSVNPSGAFIHALAATTETLPRTPVRTTGTPVQKCVHGLRRRQP